MLERLSLDDAGREGLIGKHRGRRAKYHLNLQRLEFAAVEDSEFRELPEWVARVQVTAHVPKTVHAQLATRARADGVSLNALVLTLIAQGLWARGSKAAQEVLPSSISCSLGALIPGFGLRERTSSNECCTLQTARWRNLLGAPPVNGR